MGAIFMGGAGDRLKLLACMRMDRERPAGLAWPGKQMIC